MAPLGQTNLTKLAAKKLLLPPQRITEVVIVRKALDARRKTNIHFVYTVDVAVSQSELDVLARHAQSKDISQTPPPPVFTLERGSEKLAQRPVIVGFGPAGMLAALTLAKEGYRPLVLERGRRVEDRTRDIARFWHTGEFDPASNVQFGEGGAGTFSDGKLTTRVSDPLMRQVAEHFIAAGAPVEIRYLQKAHIGTDKLRHMVKKLREMVEEYGGEVRFESQVTDICLKAGKISGVVVNGKETIDCDALLLGIGHSARDTYAMLHERGIAMEAKPFAIGVRIEHPQELIDRAQYGPAAGHPQLGAADYALVYQAKDSGRSAYSFCMCPGGLVVASSSEPGGVVSNGMSLYQRASGVANSALVVNVNPEDYGGGVLDGIAFQRRYEQLAFQCGGGNYYAPVQTVGDFLQGVSGSTDFLLQPSYQPGVTPVDLRQCLPSFVTDTLARALPDFDRKIKGFAHPGAVLTGVETRTSAPLRINRGRETYLSVNTPGLYPMGEGAGYAGGIMSAALDGMNTALALIKQYQL